MQDRPSRGGRSETVAPASRAASGPPARPRPAIPAGARGEPGFWPFVALLVLVPLPLGAVSPWARALLTASVAVLVAAMALRGRFAAVTRPLARWLVAASGVGALVLLWAGLQLLPGLGDLLGAGAAPLDPALAEASGYTPRLALAPDLARDRMLMGATSIAVFALAAVHAADAAAARRMLLAIALAAAVYAGYGLFVQLSGIERVLWYEKQAYRGWLTGTFINRNSFATYLGLGLLTTAALLIDQLGQVRTGQSGWLGKLAVLDRLDLAGWLLIAAIPVIAVALLLTGSRGGTAASVLGLGTFLVLRARREARRLRTIAATAAAVVVAATAFYGELLFERLAGTIEGLPEAARPHLYAGTAELIAERPWLGYGLGGFADAFERARGTALLNAEVVFQRAHNDYLELALELGLPAALLVCATLAALLGRCFVGAHIRRRRSRQLFPCVAAAAGLLVGAHALVDFSLQIPAVAVTFAALLGIGVAQSFAARPRSARATAEVGAAGEGDRSAAARPRRQPVQGEAP